MNISPGIRAPCRYFLWFLRPTAAEFEEQQQ